MSLLTRLVVLLAVIAVFAAPGPPHDFYVKHLQPGVQQARATVNDVLGTNK
jgi:hypothetical protein